MADRPTPRKPPANGARSGSAAGKSSPRPTPDPIREVEDEVARDPNFVLQSSAIDEWREKARLGVEEVNRRLVAAHSIPDAQAHKRLILELQDIMLQPSAVSLSPDSWRVPRDAEGWKDTREKKLELIHAQVAALITLIDGGLSNETFVEALRVVDPDARFPDAFKGLHDLEEIVGAAMSLRSSVDEEQSPRGGNRPNPVREFGEAAQRFWHIHVSKRGTRPRFVQGGLADEGDNAITRWMIDLYKAILPNMKKNYSMFRTELMTLRAYTGNGVKPDPS